MQANKKSISSIQSNRAEARRIMQICNACRYCEGFCSVFPAMTQHRNFNDNTLDHLANLCHNCRGCFYACQYAEPHEFNVNVPKTFNELRADTWRAHAWPGFLARAFERNGLVLLLLTALTVAIIFFSAALFHDADAFFSAYPDGNFKAIIPHGVMVAVAAPTFVFSLLAIMISGYHFWRHIGSDKVSSGNIMIAAGDILSLRNLGGSSHGCNNDSERFSMTRRYLHHAVFYGFLLCFAATATGTIYHYVFNWQAPHAYTSLPVLFGTSGGALLCIGSAGMLWQKFKTETVLTSQYLSGMESGFIILLFLTSFTGLLLLGVRETGAMGLALCIHLGFVLAFFLSLPYSKMIHGLYRSLSLLKNAQK